ETRRRSGVASGAVRAGSRDQVRLRDLDGRAFRREGMEGHARPMDCHSRRERARHSHQFSGAAAGREWQRDRELPHESRTMKTQAAVAYAAGKPLEVSTDALDVTAECGDE